MQLLFIIIGLIPIAIAAKLIYDKVQQKGQDLDQETQQKNKYQVPAIITLSILGVLCVGIGFSSWTKMTATGDANEILESTIDYKTERDSTQDNWLKTNNTPTQTTTDYSSTNEDRWTSSGSSNSHDTTTYRPHDSSNNEPQTAQDFELDMQKKNANLALTTQNFEEGSKELSNELTKVQAKITDDQSNSYEIPDDPSTKMNETQKIAYRQLTAYIPNEKLDEFINNVEINNPNLKIQTRSISVEDVAHSYNENNNEIDEANKEIEELKNQLNNLPEDAPENDRKTIENQIKDIEKQIEEIKKANEEIEQDVKYSEVNIFLSEEKDKYTTTEQELEQQLNDMPKQAKAAFYQFLLFMLRNIWLVIIIIIAIIALIVYRIKNGRWPWSKKNNTVVTESNNDTE